LPSLSQTDSWSSTVNSKIRPKDYHHWSWYFHKGSRLTIQWEYFSDSDGELRRTIAYLVRGKQAFDIFHAWTENSKYNAASGFNKPYQHILIESYSSEFSFDIVQDDYYFVFFWNSRKENLSGFFEYSIESKVYDLSNPSASCYLPCSLSVSPGDKLFFASPSASNFPSSSYNADFEFAPAYTIKWGLIVFILFSPFGFYLLSFILWFTCVKNWIDKRTDYALTYIKTI